MTGPKGPGGLLMTKSELCPDVRDCRRKKPSQLPVGKSPEQSPGVKTCVNGGMVCEKVFGTRQELRECGHGCSCSRL